MALHQLLERDGLRVRRAGDLQAPGESARLPRRPARPAPPLGVPQAGTGAHDCRGQARERRAWAEEDTWPCGWRRAELPRSEPPLTTRAKAKCNPLRGRALHARAQDDSLISAGPGGRDSARHAECSGRTPDSIPEALSPPHPCSMSGPAQPHGLHCDYLLPRSVQNLLLFY